MDTKLKGALAQGGSEPSVGQPPEIDLDVNLPEYDYKADIQDTVRSFNKKFSGDVAEQSSLRQFLDKTDAGFTTIQEKADSGPTDLITTAAEAAFSRSPFVLSDYTTPRMLAGTATDRVINWGLKNHPTLGHATSVALWPLAYAAGNGVESWGLAKLPQTFAKRYTNAVNAGGWFDIGLRTASDVSSVINPKNLEYASNPRVWMSNPSADDVRKTVDEATGDSLARNLTREGINALKFIPAWYGQPVFTAALGGEVPGVKNLTAILSESSAMDSPKVARIRDLNDARVSYYISKKTGQSPRYRLIGTDTIYDSALNNYNQLTSVSSFPTKSDMRALSDYITTMPGVGLPGFDPEDALYSEFGTREPLEASYIYGAFISQNRRNTILLDSLKNQITESFGEDSDVQRAIHRIIFSEAVHRGWVNPSNPGDWTKDPRVTALHDEIADDFIDQLAQQQLIQRNKELLFYLVDRLHISPYQAAVILRSDINLDTAFNSGEIFDSDNPVSGLLELADYQKSFNGERGRMYEKRGKR